MTSKLPFSISLAAALLLAAPMAVAQEAGQGQVGHEAAHGNGPQEADEDIRALLPNANKHLLFVMADSNEDGALSLEEVNAVVKRVFRAIDEDSNDQVTPEEVETFYGDIRQRAREPAPRSPGHGSHGQHDAGGSVASRAYMDAMEAMNRDMAAMEMTGDPASDFVVMMIPHHQSAVDMAEAFLEHGDDPELARLAQEIIDAQESEIEMMEKWLREGGR